MKTKALSTISAAALALVLISSGIRNAQARDIWDQFPDGLNVGGGTPMAKPNIWDQFSDPAPSAAPPNTRSSANFFDQFDAPEVRLDRQLADQGNAPAQFRLGAMYMLGQGVPLNYAEAMKWFRLAADQGNGLAQTNLGAMYEHGQGVPQDYAEAVKWYRLAADQDNYVAQSNLGALYANGRGVPQDYVSAHMWLNLSAAHGYKDAEANRDRVAQLMTPAQIAEAQRLAREWKPTTQPPR